MAKIAIARANLTAGSTGTISLLAPSGFGTPKGAMLLTGGSLPEVTERDARHCIGFCDGTNQGCLATTSIDNSTGGSATSRLIRDNATLVEIDAGSVTGIGVFSQWLTDGLELNITDAFDVDTFIVAVLFGGADLSAQAGTTVSTGSNYTVSTPFNPELVFGAWNYYDRNSQIGSVFDWVGASLGVLGQRSRQYTSRDQATSSIYQGIFNDSVTGGVWSSVLKRLAIVLQTGGFAVNYIGAGGSVGDDWPYLALNLGGANRVVGDALLPTDDTVDWVGPSLGFQPTFALISSSHVPSTQNINVTVSDSNGGQRGYHVYDGQSLASLSFSEAQNISPTSAETTCANTRWIEASTNAGAASFDIGAPTFTADGWTVPAANITAVNGTARRYWYLAIEGEAAGPPPELTPACRPAFSAESAGDVEVELAELTPACRPQFSADSAGDVESASAELTPSCRVGFSADSSGDVLTELLPASRPTFSAASAGDVAIVGLLQPACRLAFSAESTGDVTKVGLLEPACRVAFSAASSGDVLTELLPACAPVFSAASTGGVFVPPKSAIGRRVCRIPKENRSARV